MKLERRTQRSHGPLPAWFSILVLGGLLAPAAFAGAGPLWTVSTESDIVFQRLTPLGSLLVSTENDLSAFDPATGRVLWRRPDIRRLKECFYDEIAETPYGLIDLGTGMGGMKRGIEILDLQTGQSKWDALDLPLSSSLGLFQAPQRNLMLLLGAPKEGKKPRMVAADVVTGAMKWQQDTLFTKPLQLFEVRGSGKLFKRYSVEGNQVPVYDTDRTAILWLTADGPVKIDLENGRRLWVAGKLHGRTPPAFRNGFAPMTVGDGVVFVPFEQSLQAIELAGGGPVWARPREFPSHVAQMRSTPEGLVVRGAPGVNETGKVEGRSFVDLIDPRSGASLWKKPFKDLGDATPFDLRDGRLFVASDAELFSIDLAGGAAETVARFKFKGGEVPSRLEVVEGGVVLSSSQNMMWIGLDGTVKYHAFYGAPGATGGSRSASPKPAPRNVASANGGPMATHGSPRSRLTAANATLSRRLEAGESAAGFAAVLTTLEAEGRKGAGLVKLEKASGKEAAKVVLGDKSPTYIVDPLEWRVFFMKSSRELICYPF